MKYTVTFTTYEAYEIEADNEEEALKKAESKLYFYRSHTKTYSTEYDDVQIKEDNN